MVLLVTVLSPRPCFSLSFVGNRGRAGFFPVVCLHLFLAIAALTALLRMVDIHWVIVAGTVVSLLCL
jgi:hypothetical protein